MARQFNIGRQSEVLMNEKHHEIYKAMEHYYSSKQNMNGPTASDPRDPIENGALWLDRTTNVNSPDLKIYNNGEWQVISKEKFQITDSIMTESQPTDAIKGQLWIDRVSGILYYFNGVEFKPIAATQANVEDINITAFEDFLLISPIEATENKVLDNFTSLIFSNNVVKWETNKEYGVNDGAIYDLHIYVCKKAHTSSEDIHVTNSEHWTRIEYLNQYLVPDASIDRFFIDGEFIHRKTGMTIIDPNTGNRIPDPNETGYNLNSTVSITFPIEMVEGKFAHAVHVNPKRLTNITKKFIKIDKNNPIIEVPEENTEFYGVYSGVGRLLIKTDNELTSDYISAISNNTDCIQLSESVAQIYDFIYAIHYEFTDSSVKQAGKVYVKKFKLQDENYVWIGNVDASKICVFAQGLYYEEDPLNYVYDPGTGYLYIKEKLQDYSNMTKKFDFSVIAFPYVYRNKVTKLTYDPLNYVEGKGYRVELGRTPESPNMLAFLRGVQLNAGVNGTVVIYDPADPTGAYIKELTQEFINDNNEVYWCIVETDEYKNNECTQQMYRGTTNAVKKEPYGVVVPVYRDKENPVDGALYLHSNEVPFLFVDGVLTFQKEIEIGNDYVTIYGLKEGQEVVMLADEPGDDTDAVSDEYRPNSYRLLFEDAVSYATIATELNDSVIVYLQNGILCDASSVYTSIEPKDKGYHGEIRLWVNYSTEKWMMYNAYTSSWEEIPASEMTTDGTGNLVQYTDVIDKNSRGYSATRKSISFLQNLGGEYCTYYAYVYADSIEKKLLMDYCYPNDKDGVNILNPQQGDPMPFQTNFKHMYTPGKNEITVYLNGIRQNLDSPYDINYANSKNKECSFNSNNEFILAWDDNTTQGKPISSHDGYYIYTIDKLGKEEVVIKETEMTDIEKQDYISQEYNVNTLSTPTRNVIFYVIEQCESGESKACDRKVFTFRDALASKGAFSNNCYDTGEFLLTRGNIRVFINGYRQPYGVYQDKECLEASERTVRQAYTIVNSSTIQFEDILLGGIGGNEGDEANPLFPIGNIILPDGSINRAYHEVIDEIVIEIRKDFKLREVTIPILDNTGEFTIADGIPADLFKTKDKVMIYINGAAYGKEYTIENQTLKLTNDDIRSKLGHNKNDVITFEWR